MDDKIKPEVTITCYKNSGDEIRIVRKEGGCFEGDAGNREIKEILPVLEAVIADLTEYRIDIKRVVDALETAQNIEPDPLN